MCEERHEVHEERRKLHGERHEVHEVHEERNDMKAGPETAKIAYGCEQFGCLTRVILHRPGKELELINHENYRQWLFDRVPDIAGFIDEHDRYRELLVSLGVEVLELSDYVTEHCELMARLPNLTYLHDTAVICRKGAILSSMAWDGRKNEHLVVREALTRLGIPIFMEFNDPWDAFEGCLLLSPETVLVAETERYSRTAIDKFIKKALTIFPEVIWTDIPKARRYMHPDTVFNRINPHLALAYLPAFKTTYLVTRQGIEEISFAQYMKTREIEIINVSDSEQSRLACTFVPLHCGLIVHYDTALDRETRNILAKRGVEIVTLHPDALLAGGGSLRCLTLRLHRECHCSQHDARPHLPAAS